MTPGVNWPIVGFMHEPLTDAERERLRPYVTDLDGPVFALVNLPEATKGAAFARYSRSPKSLRRLLLDEFLDPGGSGPLPQAADPGRERAEALYRRVLAEYGDDCCAAMAPSGSSISRSNPADPSHFASGTTSGISPIPQLVEDAAENSGISNPA